MVTMIEKWTKNWLKQEIKNRYSEQDDVEFETSVVRFARESNRWELAIRLSHDLPEALRPVVHGFEKDIFSPKMAEHVMMCYQWMKTFTNDLFEGRVQHMMGADYNLTIPLPLMFNLTYQEGKWRHLTESEKEQYRNVEMFWKRILEEDRLVAEGYFELDPEAPGDQEEAVSIPKKYTSLRVTYQFQVPGDVMHELWLRRAEAETNKELVRFKTWFGTNFGDPEIIKIMVEGITDTEEIESWLNRKDMSFNCYEVDSRNLIQAKKQYKKLAKAAKNPRIRSETLDMIRQEFLSWVS